MRFRLAVFPPAAGSGLRRWLVVAAAAVTVLALAGAAAAAAITASGPRPAPGPQALSRPAHAATRTATARSAARAGVPAAPRTSCTSVAHIGDSTSADLISSAMLPDLAQQLPAQYTDVGVRHLLLDASGGRSIVEELPGQVNGYNVALNWWNQGYRGCWVFALGTNDAANVSVGSAVGLTARINEMMSVTRGEPVLWVNTVTQLSSGPWSEANEQAWDNALVSALARYPNMRIFNWAAVAQPGCRMAFTTTQPGARPGPRPSRKHWPGHSRWPAGAAARSSADAIAF
jgi:hypothetical protein